MCSYRNITAVDTMYQCVLTLWLHTTYTSSYYVSTQVLKGWLTVFFLGLIVFMGCSLACVHACFF